tara:strand:- start:422 stop:1132 length:711 start_codon:yes stop_codon:yes gene_type:complete
MRPLREIASSVREQLANKALAERLICTPHALIKDIKDVQTLHRPVITAAKRQKSIPWLAYSFTPFEGLIEPFQIYPGRYWAFQQMHKQPSGLPELITHISKEFPSASQALAPHHYVGFSNSKNIETSIKITSKEPLKLSFYHSGNLEKSDRTLLPADYCLEGLGLALSQADTADDIPGLHGEQNERSIYVGSLVFYNLGRTPNRSQLSHFLLNNAAISVVLRYVRDAVGKSLKTAE